MDGDLEKPLSLAKGRLSWSWKFQMMRVGLGWGAESSILGGQYRVQPLPDLAQWDLESRCHPWGWELGFPSQWPKVATFFRAKARQRFCPYFPNPLKGWKPPNLVFPHLMCRPDLYPPPSWYCSWDNLCVAFTWHGEPALGVTSCHLPVGNAHLLSDGLCLPGEGVLDVFILDPLWKRIWFWFCELLGCFLSPQRNWEIKRRRGRIRRTGAGVMSLQPIKGEKSLSFCKRWLHHL